MSHLRLILLLSGLGFLPCVNGQEVRFDRDIRPILSDKCYFCHGPDAEHRAADLRFDVEAEAREAIVAGDPEASELIARIKSTDPDMVMPPPSAHKELKLAEVKLLTRWIEAGAPWSKHWSFNTPIQPELPQLETDLSLTNPIDAFVASRLNLEGKTFAPAAAREKLIRRVTYDLTGMPPTLAEIEDFLKDDSDTAYEKVLDRLLESPRYGQRMGLAWLDAARYGDTSVYHADGPRDMWAWRDAIVDAYNRNVPFDEFSICQLAGDLLPDATLQQRLLAGFNRNNGTTDEGGAIAEEYRVEYAVDRVKTTSMVWLGLTMECAQCHDHKYDPISQEEYYRFFAFFNVSSDGGMQTRKGNATPMLEVPDPEKERQLPAAKAELQNSKDRLAEIESNCQSGFESWLATASTPDPNAAAVGTEGCLVNLPLLKGTGKTVNDLVDASRAHAINGKAEWVKSRTDFGLKFDGSNFLDLGNVCDFERTDSFSYGGWFKPDKGAGVGGMIAKMDGGNGHRGYDLYGGHSPVSVHIINTWPGNAIKVTTKKKLKANVWQHVFATYDGSSKAQGIKIYVDGEEWPWNIEQDGLSDTIRTETHLQIGSRHPSARMKGQVDEVQVFARKLEQAEVQSLAKAMTVQGLLTIEAEKRTEEQTDLLRNYYLSTESEDYRAASKAVDKLNAKVADLSKPLTTVMIMGDMEKPRDTFILNRGSYDSPTDRKVDAGTMEALPPMPDDAPKNRLGLARWLFQEDHPLTARVAVNRYWQMFFGTGLVSTAEDFGAQGEYPSHPELLDWLAVDFRENGWDTKRFIKQLLMSQTYQQSSRATFDQYREDPSNRLLARGSRFRLQGEFIRDTALDLSGLLNDQFGGPGVKPYQPPGLWAEVGLGANPKFVQDRGEKLYRRSLYTYWKRSAPPPAMQIFDAPTREKCTIQRARTNTPLQALVTLNDEQFVEAARKFAERIVYSGSQSTEKRISLAFRMATARRPDGNDVKVLKDVFESSVEKFKADPAAAVELLKTGASPRDETLDPAHHAAWTIVASAILNLDETLTRE